MSNALFAPGIELAKSWAGQRDAAHERVIASRKNSPEKLVAEIRTDEATTDEKVKAWQEREEKVMAALNAEREKINAYIRENLVKVNSDYDETADVETVKELNGRSSPCVSTWKVSGDRGGLYRLPRVQVSSRCR